MKAIKLLKQSIDAKLSIIETYHERAEFALFKKDGKGFKYNSEQVDDYLKSIKEVEEAIEEINELLKNK